MVLGTQEASPPPGPRSDLHWMITVKSVENIQLLPFLATDAKYAGGTTFWGQGVEFRGWA